MTCEIVARESRYEEGCARGGGGVVWDERVVGTAFGAICAARSGLYSHGRNNPRPHAHRPASAIRLALRLLRPQRFRGHSADDTGGESTRGKKQLARALFLPLGQLRYHDLQPR